MKKKHSNLLAPEKDKTGYKYNQCVYTSSLVFNHFVKI